MKICYKFCDYKSPENHILFGAVQNYIKYIDRSNSYWVLYTGKTSVIVYLARLNTRQLTMQIYLLRIILFVSSVIFTITSVCTGFNCKQECHRQNVIKGQSIFSQGKRKTSKKYQPFKKCSVLVFPFSNLDFKLCNENISKRNIKQLPTGPLCRICSRDSCQKRFSNTNWSSF